MVKRKLSIFMVIVMIFSLFSASGISANTNDSEGERPHWRFDFGTESSSVAGGYTKVSDLTGYTSDRGYGFDEVNEGNSEDQGDDLRRDFVLAHGHTFTVDLPDGEYDVQITTGSNWDYNETTYSLQGGELQGGEGTNGGEFITYEDTAVVSDGELTIYFSGAWARINAIEIIEKDVDDPLQYKFDLGTQASPIEDGYTKVSEVTLYDSDKGYGLDSAAGSRDQANNLTRDFVIAGGNSFKVDLPNGDYKTIITTGAEWDDNQTSYSLQGGEVRGGELTSAGNFITYEDTVPVENGQLDISFLDDARINAVEIVPVLMITSLEVSEISLGQDSYVILNWDSMDEAESYDVFRKEEGEDRFTLIDNTSESNYKDETTEIGNTYTYAVSPVSDLDIESVRSNEVTVSMIDENVSAPRNPMGLKLVEELTEEEVTISWNRVNDADLYYVYRTRFHEDQLPNVEESFERIGVTDELTFTDENIYSSNPYYYVVMAVNEGGISEASRILAAQAEEKSKRLNKGSRGPFDARVIQSGDTWRAINRGVVYSGDDMLEAMQAAVDSLTSDRTSQEKVIVRGSGTIPGDESLDLPSHTSFEVDGTIHVEGTGDPFSYGDHSAAVRILHAENVSIPRLNITGTPNYGIFVRTSEDIHLGQIDLRLDGGLGLRIESRDDDSVYGTRDVRIDDVYVSGTSDHGVETYGVDGISIGNVTAVNTGYAGVLLNDTINAEIDTVYGYGAGTGTGYAAFRMANRNGNIDDEYTKNISVGEVIARGGGRGIFSVSRSGGAVIERVDIANTGNNAMLIENSFNITIEGGVVEGPSGIRIAARSDMPNTSDILMKNLTLRNSEILESPCGENVEFRNITLENSTMDICSE
ncbi:fibronectin type III domain-containing protein [Salipaludibacillus sp. HK11]|uniref:fibronectin type III domain-containing protein n=1 Tax=Salipaludibacillus sp. HK11 TaxID=3394320 RepID=UPI0039FD4D71